MAIHDWTRVNAGIFHDFHHEWISAIKRCLNSGLLPPDYYALAEQVAGGLGPDVLTLEGPPCEDRGGNGSDHRIETQHGGVAVATSPPQVRFTAKADIEEFARRQYRVAIRHISDDDVVAIVEIISPGNKSSRHAIRSCVNKAVELLHAGIHLLIIDVFPPGRRDPQGMHAAIWSELTDDSFQLPPDKPLILASYSAGPTTCAYIEPLACGDSLPDMPLFLSEELYVPVPLDTAYRAAFEAVPLRWRRELDRSGDPP